MGLLEILDYLIWLLFDPCKFTVVRRRRIRNVVIVHKGAIGELLVLTPIARALKDRCHARVTMMVSPGREEVFRGNPSVDDVLVFSDSHADTLAALRRQDLYARVCDHLIE